MNAKLTEPYLVFLAMHNVDVTVPAGTEFEMIAKLRDNYYGLYQHPQYGEICVQTSDAIECDDGSCRSCVGGKCVTGPECVTLGRD